MTRAFQRFLEQLDRDAPDKQDGFDAANIRKLGGDERDEARRRLNEAIGAGDDTAIEGLLALDGDAALATLASMLQTTDEFVRIRIVRALVNSGRLDPDVLAALGDLLASRQSAVRVQALVVAQELPDIAAKQTLLSRYLGDEPVALYRSGAARALLKATGRMPDDAGTPSFDDLLAALRGDDADARATALAQIGL